MSRFVDADFIAEDLGVSVATAYRYMNQMYALRTGGTVRVTRHNYEAWLRRRSGWADEGSQKDASTREETSGGESSPEKTEKRNANRSDSRSQRHLRTMPSPSGSLDPENIVMPKPRRRRRA